MRDKVRRSGAWWWLVVGLGGGMGMDGALCLGLYLSHTHPRRWGTCTKRRGACTAHVLPSLSQPHPRGYTVELISVRKGSPRGNLTRVLVVHSMEGGSSTTVNKKIVTWRVMLKRGKPCGAYLRGKALYTGVLLMCPVNSQNEEKLAYYSALRPLPRPRARWLAGRGANFTTPSVYSSSLPWLERLSYCLEYICSLVLPPFTYTRPL